MVTGCPPRLSAGRCQHLSCPSADVARIMLLRPDAIRRIAQELEEEERRLDKADVGVQRRGRTPVGSGSLGKGRPSGKGPPLLKRKAEGVAASEAVPVAGMPQDWSAAWLLGRARAAAAATMDPTTPPPTKRARNATPAEQDRGQRGGGRWIPVPLVPPTPPPVLLHEPWAPPPPYKLVAPPEPGPLANLATPPAVYAASEALQARRREGEQMFNGRGGGGRVCVRAGCYYAGH